MHNCINMVQNQVSFIEGCPFSEGPFERFHYTSLNSPTQIKAHNSMPATEASRRILAENDLNSSGSQSRGKTSCCAR